MSFATLISRTLVLIVSLSLINEGVNGLHITELNRRDGDDDGDDDDDDDGHSTHTHTHTSKTSHISSATISSATISSVTGTRNTLLPSSTNSSLPASATPNRLTESRHVGTIVGAVLGSFILVGLGAMILAKYRSRARKARKRPRGSLPSTFFTDQPPRMSQAQNSALVVPSAPLTSHPEPMQSLNALPNNNDTRNSRSSLSPLFPGASLYNPQDTSSSAYQRLSMHESDSSHAPSSPLQSYDMQPSSSLAVSLPQKAASAGSVPSTTSGQPSSLHRDMAEFQLALENDHKRHVSNSDQSPIINDPPPRYVDNAATSSV